MVCDLGGATPVAGPAITGTRSHRNLSLCKTIVRYTRTGVSEGGLNLSSGGTGECTTTAWLANYLEEEEDSPPLPHLPRGDRRDQPGGALDRNSLTVHSNALAFVPFWWEGVGGRMQSYLLRFLYALQGQPN